MSSVEGLQERTRPAYFKGTRWVVTLTGRETRTDEIGVEARAEAEAYCFAQLPAAADEDMYEECGGPDRLLRGTLASTRTRQLLAGWKAAASAAITRNIGNVKLLAATRTRRTRAAKLQC